MKSIIKSPSFIFLIGILFYVSCKKETSCEGCKGNNKPPIAIAGPDQLITLPTDSILLDGRSSKDPDGMISSYLWTKISGPVSFTIVQALDSITQVNALVVGSYLFELKVTDNGGLSAKDTIKIIVDPDFTTNHPPIANAGADQTIIFPSNTVNLDGSASTDQENNITSYVWTKITGPSSLSIINSNAVQTQITNLVQGIYQFELRVTDAGGLFSKDTMQVTVNSALSDPCPLGRPLVAAQLIPIGTLSIARLGMSISSAGNKLLFAGGYNEAIQLNANGGISVNRVDIYDMVTQNWSSAELSLYRSNMGVAVAGNKIFFAGGSDWNDSWLNVQYKRVDIYDASSGSWTIDSLSWPRASPAGEVIGNKVFFGGGLAAYISTGHGNIVDIKDISTNTWSATTLSEEKAYLSSATIGDKIYFAGGAHGYYYTIISDRIDVYNNVTSSWSSETLPEPKEWMASIGLAGKIYWAGGMTGSPPVNRHMSGLVEIKDATTNTSTQACLFQPNARFSAVLKNNKIVFFTGAGTEKNKFDIYDPATNVWSIGILPVNIEQAAVLSVNNIIYVAGGIVNDVLSNQVWKLEF